MTPDVELCLAVLVAIVFDVTVFVEVSEGGEKEITRAVYPREESDNVAVQYGSLSSGQKGRNT